MKKKVLLLTLATTIVLTACGGNAKNESTDVNTAVTEDVENVESVVVEDIEVEDVAASEQPKIEEAVDDYTKGTITESGWESQWLGLRYTAPEGMKMVSEADLHEIMGLGEMLGSEDYEQLKLEYAKLQTVQEMRSIDENNTSVFVTVEKLTSSGVTAEKFVELISKTLSKVSAIQYEIPESSEKVQIAGEEYVKLAVSADVNGNHQYQDYYVRIVGNRALHIIVTYAEDTKETAELIMNGYTAY